MADKDVIKGQAKQVEGRVRKAVGDLTGDTDQKIKGTGKDIEGKVQEGWGRVKDGARTARNEPATPS
jgi:uncharacterized protein YjbJ (UPF0337 family)